MNGTLDPVDRTWARRCLIVSAIALVSCGPTVRDREGHLTLRPSIEDSLEIFDVPPLAVLSPAPQYPPQALASGLGGRVWVRVTVAASGYVVATSVDSTEAASMLTNAALRTLKTWRFEPAQRHGRAVMSQIVIPVRFRPTR